MKPMIDWLSVKMVKPCVLHSSCNVLPYILSCLPESNFAPVYLASMEGSAPQDCYSWPKRGKATRVWE